MEALLRWSSPQLGDVSPGEFIPIAEDTGSIIAIGAWVMRESCDTIARISAQLGRPIEVSVNVSALQLGFVQSVRQTLAHAGLPAASLRLEITESALMRPDAVTIRSLRELEALGVHAALDDFGTGFSSLSLLKRHPLAAIKIDRSFVTGLADDPRDRAIVAAVTNMAHASGSSLPPRAWKRSRSWRACANSAATGHRGSCWRGQCRRTNWSGCSARRGSTLRPRLRSPDHLRDTRARIDRRLVRLNRLQAQPAAHIRPFEYRSDAWMHLARALFAGGIPSAESR